MRLLFDDPFTVISLQATCLRHRALKGPRDEKLSQRRQAAKLTCFSLRLGESLFSQQTIPISYLIFIPNICIYIHILLNCNRSTFVDAKAYFLLNVKSTGS